MLQLTLQLYSAGQWRDAMTLAFPEPGKGLKGPCRFGYKHDYLVENLHVIDRPFSASVSACVPLDWDARHTQEAPAFLHDIAPAGAAKKILTRQIGREKPDGLAIDLFLLGRSTPAPIGHLRIKESYERLDVTAGIESAGQINWRAACESLGAIIAPQMAFERLRADAEQLRALPDLLSASGLPDLTMNHPQIALKHLDKRLQEWGLK